MPGKRKKSSDSHRDASIAFVDRLTETLDKFHAVEWLGQHSPLAAPYFLGDYLLEQPAADSATGRGTALQSLIRAGLDKLDTPKNRTASRLLRVSYLDRTPRELIADTLSISMAGYHRERRRAIALLSAELLQLVTPSLRLERPPASIALLERDEPRRRAVDALDKGAIVAISGNPGVGKTALAAAVAHELRPAHTFWHTCAPGLGDNLISFVFGLGHYLMRKGAPDLWLYLVSEWRDSDLDRAATQGSVCAAITRTTLRRLSAKALICIDEYDELRPDQHAAHAQLQAFLQQIAPDAHLLLIGAPSAIAEVTVPLDGLPIEPVRTLLEQHDVRLSGTHLAELMRLTHGNPRLVQLIISLHQLGESVTMLFENRYLVASLDGFYRRVWQRLMPDQRQILMTLAVAHKPVPREIWHSEADSTSLLRLIELNLVDDDALGGVALTPAFMAATLDLLDADQREKSHLYIANIRSNYGQYTEAAYHYVKAGQPAIALHLWNEHKASQINHGQASAALRIFRGITLGQLPPTERELLHLLRAELSRIAGEYGYAEQELTAGPISESSPYAISFLTQKGDLYYLRDQADKALQAYREALRISEQHWQVLQQIVITRADLARAYVEDEPQFEEAWHQVLMARYEIEFLQAHVLKRQQRFSECLPYYRMAIDTALSAGHLEGEAQARANYAAVMATISTAGEAIVEIETHLQRSIEIFEKTGRASQMASKLNDLALVFNLAGQPERALPYATQALARARALNWPSMVAAAAQNLSESELALNHLAEAEAAAREVLNTEEPRFISDGLRVLGEVYLARQDYKLAEQLILQAIQEAVARSNTYLEAYAWRALGRCYVATAKKSKAIEAYQKASHLFGLRELTDEQKKTEVELQALVI